jgi:hypothetical protein
VDHGPGDLRVPQLAGPGNGLNKQGLNEQGLNEQGLNEQGLND